MTTPETPDDALPSEASTTTPQLARSEPDHDLARQDWPRGALYVVATPIGNLADLSPRARYALSLADVIAAEDTRTSRPLLAHWHIDRPLIAAHQHNEAKMAAEIVTRLQRQERVALISDAGTPAVSDPGARIVRAVRAAGLRVIPLPGPSAVLTALMASGMTSDAQPAFAFAGFPPVKSQARQSWLRQWCQLPAPVVMFEAPHRLKATLRDLRTVCGEQRELTIARELTKRFEDIACLLTGDVEAWLQAGRHQTQGEFVLIVGAAAPTPSAEANRHDELLHNLLPHMSVRDAARIATLATGAPRQSLYRRALQLRDTEPATDPEPGTPAERPVDAE